MENLQTPSIVNFYSLPPQAQKKTNHIWTVSCSIPFNEMLISWNALRPSSGHYVILSRVLINNQWSPWLLYAVWGSQEQFSFHDSHPSSPVRSFQDQVEILDNQLATGFCIRVEACNGANLENFYDLYASTSNIGTPWPTYSAPHHSISLPVPKISQLCLPHPRSRSFCSPTSTTAVIQHLLSHHQLCPMQFANQVYDAGFDIYGNWSFNVAQAFVELGSEWHCFCARMPHIEWLWRSLQNKWPVVISIKGSLPRTFLPYKEGHLIVIRGFDAKTKQFLCMDPAFPSNDQTEVVYPWQELMQVWQNRHYLTYFFLPRNKLVQ